MEWDILQLLILMALQTTHGTMNFRLELETSEEVKGNP